MRAPGSEWCRVSADDTSGDRCVLTIHRRSEVPFQDVVVSEKLLGVGQMSAVYEAAVGSQKMAICVPQTTQADPNIDAWREVDSHTNIVTFLGLTLHPKSGICVLSELCLHGDLGLVARSFAENKKQISNEVLLEVANQVCNACSHLTEHNILHNDIHIHNVLVTSFSGQRAGTLVKLGDFGRAVKLGDNPAMLNIRAPLVQFYDSSGHLMAPSVDVLRQSVNLIARVSLDLGGDTNVYGAILEGCALEVLVQGTTWHQPHLLSSLHTLPSLLRKTIAFACVTAELLATVVAAY